MNLNLEYLETPSPSPKRHTGTPLHVETHAIQFYFVLVCTKEFVTIQFKYVFTAIDVMNTCIPT